jgi:hypothetical protein
MCSSQSLDELKTIALGHIDISDDKVARLLSEVAYPFATIPHFANTMSRSLKSHSEDFTKRGIVIDDKNGRHVGFPDGCFGQPNHDLTNEIVTPSREGR